MKVIVNCDDLGADATVNQCIFELMAQRRVTSATLMMNAPAVEDAVRQIGNYGDCSFGVHLNVTEFRPLCGHPGLFPLLNEKGEFAGNAQPHPRNIPLTSSIRQGVYGEWCAQIERALMMGVPVSHLDSHHHVHTRPSLLGILRKIQRKFRIRRIRLRSNVLGTSKTLRRRLHVARQYLWNLALQDFVHAKTTDRFSAFSAFHERLQAGFGRNGSIELMCHPGRERFAAETALLRGPWKEQLADEVELISYNQLY
jgi:predicted glycoside hydrolase/deacetylase ChbG (UPF0249 family)